MNKTTPLLLALLAFFSLSCHRDGFSVKGRVEGLQTGDTLFLHAYALPSWKTTETDTLIAGRDNRFGFSKRADSTGLYLLEYRPGHSPAPVSCNRGCLLYARKGDRLRLYGTTGVFPALTRHGGMYDDPRLGRILHLEDSLHIERNRIYRKLMQAASQNPRNPDSMAYYGNAYNNCRSQELHDKTNAFCDSADDSEYAAAEYLQKLYAVSLPAFEERFARFTPAVKASTFGRVLEHMLDVKRNVEPGRSPADFTVTATDGQPVRLSDYRGKYLLIYHWSPGCPGTSWAHPRLLELYRKYREYGFDVLGFTDTPMEGSRYDTPASRNSEAFGPLFDQPWTTVLTTRPENAFIKDELYFNGVPILMLVSPAGETLYRGYTEAYAPIGERLEELTRP